ncbi:MAG: class I SAM-dependent methyltransferase [Verrucomicrobiota bacterium]
MNTRSVQPEILDSLAPDSTEAIRNRHELRFLNHFMGSFRWFSKQIHSYKTADTNILELGSGDGSLAQYLIKRDKNLSRQYHALDTAPKPQNLSNEVVWIQQNALNYDNWDQHNICIVNLLLHQFKDEDLSQLGLKMQKCRFILANEPARYRIHQRQVALLDPFFSYVSRHDARVSIAAGFRGNELAELLGLPSEKWALFYTKTFFGAYRMIAVRKD